MDVINKPVLICDRIWWVGHFLENDDLQCHTYLIEAGRDSVLVDPGSKLTFPGTLKKIEQIIPFDSIRFFIVHHQDPDIAGALDIIDTLINRDDAVILTHWRAIALLKHMALKLPMQCVEKMGWRLRTSELDLSFIFTPYLHFPGSFCTLDNKTGSLFTSDLFGAFTEKFSLFAEDESHFEKMKTFHEHYMPSREILAHAMEQISRLEVNCILPQHGSIIKKELITFMIEKLKQTDCGLYLYTVHDTDIIKLSRLNKFLNNFLDTLISFRSFEAIVGELLEQLKTIIPVQDISFISKNHSDKWLLLDKTTEYRSEIISRETLGTLLRGNLFSENVDTDKINYAGPHSISLPLTGGEGQTVIGQALIELGKDLQLDRETERILLQLSNPLGIALERDLLEQKLDREKQQFYELSIRDNLTGFYNRTYMDDTLPRIFAHHDQKTVKEVAALALDLDHFKRVNDLFGHPAGDQVLKTAARCIAENLRAGDIAVRTGGEEFAIFLILEQRTDGLKIADRIREDISALDFSDIMGDKERQTISGGLVFRRHKEKIESLLARSDKCLYKAKKSGRNRIVEG